MSFSGTVPTSLVIENRQLRFENDRLRDYLRELLQADECMEFLPKSYEKMARDLIAQRGP